MYDFVFSYDSEENCHVCKCRTEVGMFETQGPTKNDAMERMKRKINDMVQYCEDVD